jgi:hypothetical protein
MRISDLFLAKSVLKKAVWQVSWLTGSSFPITVAGPCGILTRFPFNPRIGLIRECPNASQK